MEDNIDVDDETPEQQALVAETGFLTVMGMGIGITEDEARDAYGISPERAAQLLGRSS